MDVGSRRRYARGAVGPRVQGTALLLPALIACSSGGSGGGGSPQANDTADGGGTAVVATGDNTNPDGVAYPSPPGGYGHMARKGATPGSIIQNFKFLGYPDSNEANGLQTIALADYYDPCNKRLKLLHLSVAAVWCVPCQDETQAMVASASQLASEGVVVIQALSDGPTKNVGATVNDLNYWVKTNMTTFTEMLDPNLTNLGTFFDAAAVPWNADIDPRTMEILDAATGWAGTVAQELAPGIAAAKLPPDYPVAVSCP
jgi:hypothetical protein